VAIELMTNPVHLLVTPRKPLAIAKLMQSVGRHYVRYVNGPLSLQRYPVGGALHGQPGGLRALRARLLSLIELKPVRAGMVLDPADCRRSSYRRNAGGGADVVVTEHAEYTALGGSLAARCEAYRELFRVDLDAERC
jgi:putative transposase